MGDLVDVIVDEPIDPGQYHYIAMRAWWMASFGTRAKSYAYLAEHRTREWVPADPRREWLLQRENTGHRRWLSGNAEQAIADGFEVVDMWPTGEWRAPYGDYYAADERRRPGAREGWWQVPTPEFLVSLPRDSRLLLQRLRADGREDGPGYNGALVYALDALRTGLVPAEVRAALYGALLMLPGMTTVETAANVNGDPAVALVHNDGIRQTEIFIDPGNGHFIGEREVVIKFNGLPRGTVTTSTAVRRATVGTLGVEPTEPGLW